MPKFTVNVEVKEYVIRQYTVEAPDADSAESMVKVAYLEGDPHRFAWEVYHAEPEDGSEDILDVQQVED